MITHTHIYVHASLERLDFTETLCIKYIQKYGWKCSIIFLVVSTDNKGLP